MKKIAFIAVALTFILVNLVGCDTSHQTTVYPVQRVDPETHSGHDRMALNPTTYRIGANEVVGETVGMLTRHEGCAVLDDENWNCTYSDESASFGMRDGSFWVSPEWDDIEHVSRFEYNLIRCKWAYDDPYEGRFGGMVRCIAGWR